MNLLCCEGPFDGRLHTLEPGQEACLLSDSTGLLALYRLETWPGGQRLLFVPESLPAYATFDRPAILRRGDREYRVWPATRGDGKVRWRVDDGAGVHLLSPKVVDVDTSIAELEALLTQWLRLPFGISGGLNRWV